MKAELMARGVKSADTMDPLVWLAESRLAARNRRSLRLRAAGGLAFVGILNACLGSFWLTNLVAPREAAGHKRNCGGRAMPTIDYRCVLFLAILLVATRPDIAGAAPYEWTDKKGNKIEADYVKTEGPRVVLRDADGKVHRAPFNQLSEEDQAWLRELKRLMGSRVWGRGRLSVKGSLVGVGVGVAVKVDGADRVELVYPTREDLRWVDDLLMHKGADLTAPLLFMIAVENWAEQYAYPESIWTNTQGRKLEGRFVGLRDGKVVIRADDRNYDVSLMRLSSGSQREAFGRFITHVLYQTSCNGASFYFILAKRTLELRGEYPAGQGNRI